MASKTFAVMGATGQIGRVMTETLLQGGHEVRAIGRDARKLSTLKGKGARTLASTFDDTGALTEAFSGSDGVFVMIPPDQVADDFADFQDRTGERIREAVILSRVKKVLNLSSIGAQHAEGTGPVQGLHRQEQRLNAVAGIDVLHLRPCYFMQNCRRFIPAIRERGVIASALMPDLPIWMVSTEDIGRKAAEILMQVDFREQSFFEFVGPQQITQTQATGIIGHALGRPELRYVQLSYDEEMKNFLKAGMKPATADLFVRMEKGFNEGLFATTGSLGIAHRGSTPFESFARVFAAAMQGQPVGV
jgi:uncharacterized protein YbjT (DUF2867 family)